MFSAAGSAVAIAAVIFAPSAAPARAETSARGCHAKGSKTILGTGTIRVFRTRRHYDPNYAAGAHVDSVYACWRPTGRRTRIDIETPDGYFSEQVLRVKLAPGSRRMIGYETELVGRGGTTDEVHSLDVRRGKVVHDTSRDLTLYGPPAANLGITQFIVTPTGSLAWIGGGRCPSPRLSADGVYAIGTDGSEQRLQCGDPNGDFTSRFSHSVFSRLTYTQGVVSWQAPTGPMTAPLP